MGISEDIAALSMGLSASRVQQDYSVAVAKKAMEGLEDAALQEITDMMPAVPRIPKGEILDVSV